MTPETYSRLDHRVAGSKISFTNSSRYQRENCMAENGQLTGTFRVKSGMAQMLKGGVIMDVVDAEQARIAEEGPWPSWPWSAYPRT